MWSGNYTCQATNSLGKESQDIEVSGKPLPPEVLPGTPTGRKTEFRLRWRVRSAFPVKQHNIFIERILEGQFRSDWRSRCYGQSDCTDCRGTESCHMITRQGQKNLTGGWRSSMEELKRVLRSQVTPSC